MSSSVPQPPRWWADRPTGEGDLRILLVCGRLAWSTSTRHAFSLAKGLLALEHQVQLVGFPGPAIERFRKLGIEVYDFHGSWFPYRRLIGFLREYSPDVVHAVGGKGALTIATRIARNIESPLIHTVHSWLANDRTLRLPRNIAGVIAVNQDLRENLVNSLGVKKSLVRVIPYGIEDPGPIPVQLPITERIPTIGTIGRLVPGRRLDDFLNAARLISDQLGEVLFPILGEGPDEGRLRRVCRKLDLEGSVTFAEPPASLDAVYGSFDLFVLVSDWGGVGVHLLEGMVRGKSVIATGGGDVLSFLGEEGICELVPPGEPDLLARASLDLLADPARGEKIGLRAREHVLQHYPAREMLAQTEAFYASLRETAHA